MTYPRVFGIRWSGSQTQKTPRVYLRIGTPTINLILVLLQRSAKSRLKNLTGSFWDRWSRSRPQNTTKAYLGIGTPIINLIFGDSQPIMAKIYWNDSPRGFWDRCSRPQLYLGLVHRLSSSEIPSQKSEKTRSHNLHGSWRDRWSLFRDQKISREYLGIRNPISTSFRR